MTYTDPQTGITFDDVQIKDLYKLQQGKTSEQFIDVATQKYGAGSPQYADALRRATFSSGVGLNPLFNEVERQDKLARGIDPDAKTYVVAGPGGSNPKSFKTEAEAQAYANQIQSGQDAGTIAKDAKGTQFVNPATGKTPEQEALLAKNTGKVAAFGGTEGGTVPANPATGAPATNEAIKAVYFKRPDLQAVYNADGTAKDPNDPRIAGIPTLTDWVVKFGVNEEPTLSGFKVTATEFDPTKYGIDAQTWAGLTPGDKAFIESAAGILQSQFDSGQADVSINQDLLNKALSAAQNDPNILAKYGDAAKTAANDVAFALGQINANWGVQNTQQQLELEKQRKDLADQIASKGQAYSGYRRQAEDLLKAQQSTVIQSSRSQLQNALQGLGRAYETRFGSQELAKIQPIAAGNEAYTPVGGLTGSESIGKQQDVEQRQLDIFNKERL